MMVFWLIAAAMIAAALAAVLPPLLGTRKSPAANRTATAVAVYRQLLAELETDRNSGTLNDTEQHQARQELERAALETLDRGDDHGHPAPAQNRISAIVIALAIPMLAFGLYLQLGTPGAIGNDDAGAVTATAADTAAVGNMPHSIEEMVARLKSRLTANPEDAEGWAMLGRSYAAMNRVEAARDAYAQAVQRKPDDPAMLVDYAEVLARLNDGDVRGYPAELVHAALQYAPEDPDALWLAGIAAFQAGDFQHARERFERLRDLGGFGPDQAELIDDAIARASAGRTGGAGEIPATQAPVAAPPTAAAQISVHVQLAPELAAQTTPTQTVFIFARAPDGPRMPLAVVRKQVRDLPLTVTLDDSLAMRPELRLSKFPEVMIEARVSKSGNPAAAPGDLHGVSGRIGAGASVTVEVAINQVMP